MKVRWKKLATICRNYEIFLLKVPFVKLKTIVKTRQNYETFLSMKFIFLFQNYIDLLKIIFICFIFSSYVDKNYKYSQSCIIIGHIALLYYHQKKLHYYLSLTLSNVVHQCQENRILEMERQEIRDW